MLMTTLAENKNEKIKDILKDYHYSKNRHIEVQCSHYLILKFCYC